MAVWLIAGCAFIFAAKTVKSQEQDTNKVYKLGEVVISANRVEKNIHDIGRSISVITSADIKNSGVSNVSELLIQEEGIYATGAQQNPGSLTNLYTRGSNSNHTVIMVDGMPVTDPSTTDNAINLAEISIADVDRIEIIRGSHSTLYGSYAIGGVINIITRKNDAKPGIHVDASINGGVFNKNGNVNTENLFLNYTHKSGFYVNAEVFNQMSKGFNSTVDTITNPNTYKHSDQGDDFSKNDLVGKMGYHSKKWEVFAGYKMVIQNTDIDDGAFRDDDNYTSKLDRSFINYGAQYKFSDRLSIGINGGMSMLDRHLTDDSSRVDTLDKSYSSGDYFSTFNNNEFQLNYRIKGLQIVAGGGINKETMTAQTYYYSNSWGVYETRTNLDSLDIFTNESCGFLHADINGELFNSSLKPYSLALGARYVEHSRFGSTLTYEINPSVKINENCLFYISYSTGYNAPSLYQLYSPEKDPISGITRGNLTLKPEESQSWEVGIKQDLNEQINWSICYFNTLVETAVDYVYLWNKNTPIDSLTFMDYYGDTYINLGKQRNRGIEFSISTKITEKFSISGNFSLISGKLSYKPSDIDTSHTHGHHIQLYSNGVFVNKETETLGLVRRPSTANLSFSYLPFNKLLLRLEIKFVGNRNPHLDLMVLWEPWVLKIIPCSISMQNTKYSKVFRLWLELKTYWIQNIMRYWVTLLAEEEFTQG